MTLDELEVKLSEIVQSRTELAARTEWSEIQLGHDVALYDYRFDHVRLVVTTAKHIATTVDADLEVVSLAAWLHDIAKPGMGGVQKHEEASAKMAQEILLQEGVDVSTVDRVCDTIRKHVGLTLTEPVQPLEAEVLWDADKIAKLGVAGLFHFLVNGIKMNPGMDLHSIAAEIREFILLAEKIAASMNTIPGKEMALQRLRTLQNLSSILDGELNPDCQSEVDEP
ncbi:MAG: HD domain-containing protein [Candidatus Thorarchaeota archaeon]